MQRSCAGSSSATWKGRTPPRDCGRSCGSSCGSECSSTAIWDARTPCAISNSSVRRGRRRPEAGGDPVAHRRDQRLLRAQRVGRGLDRSAEDHLDCARFHAEAAFGKNVAPAPDRDGHDRHPRLEGHHEPALLEGEKAPIRAARPLGEDHDGDSPAEGARGSLETADRLLAVGTVDEDEPRQPQGPAEDRDVEKLPLGHHAKFRRHRYDERGDVELALVVRDINEGPGGSEPPVEHGLGANTIGLQHQPRPESRDRHQCRATRHQQAKNDSETAQKGSEQDHEKGSNEIQRASRVKPSSIGGSPHRWPGLTAAPLSRTRRRCRTRQRHSPRCLASEAPCLTWTEPGQPIASPGRWHYDAQPEPGRAGTGGFGYEDRSASMWPVQQPPYAFLASDLASLDETRTCCVPYFSRRHPRSEA